MAERPSTVEIAGGCLCGTVRFRIRGEFGNFHLCHCRQCQQATGSAHAANLFAAADALEWTQGEGHVARFDLPGRTITSTFCSTCGAGLPYRSVSGQSTVVPAGSLDSHPPLRPSQHIFWDERMPWYEALSTLPHHDGFDARPTSPRLRPQYHFRKVGTGATARLDAWYVQRLITLSAPLPIKQINPRDIDELTVPHWYLEKDSNPSPASIMEHIQLIQACDLTYPIILDANGRVMDGMHRICRAILEDKPTLAAVQFEVDPQPDYVDCEASTLPYTS